MQLFGKNWYVSNAQAGNGDATSWANAMNMKNLNMHWHSSYSTVLGDTVFIDGGTDNLTYTWAILLAMTVLRNMVYWNT